MNSNIFCSKEYDSRYFVYFAQFNNKVFLNSHVSYSQRGKKSCGDAGDTAHMTK